jgi:glycosyltransferase involved in cell wall biosynthesis
LTQEARLSVVPIDNVETASGQITVVNAMFLRRPLIATRCNGTEDYVEHGLTGLLTEPRSRRDLADAIGSLWDDEPRRAELAANARYFALQHLTKDVAGAAFTDILLEFENQRTGRRTDALSLAGHR